MSRIANGSPSFALRTLAFIVVMGALMGTRALAADDAEVGLIEAATGVVSITRADGASGIAGAGQALRRGETVHTERDSTARLRFSDGSDVVLRPSSRVRVDDYTFDPLRPQSDNFALRLIKGGLRSITGTIARRNRDRVSYSTITATIGIRGTDFMMRLCDDDCAREEMTAGGTRLSDAAVARVGALSGGVSALRPDGRWRALDAGDAVYPDDAIVTGAGGVAVLFFLDDTRVTLQPRSILIVEDYAYDAAAPARGGAVLVLLEGGARTRSGAIAKANAERFVFLTPERRIRVHGTLFDTVVQTVTGAVESAGEQADQAAQRAQDATKKAADTAQQVAQNAAVTLQNTNTRVEQGQIVASNVIAKVNQAGDEAVQNPPAVETTPTPSGGPERIIPVPTADVDVGRVVGQIGAGVVETWREVTGAGAGAANEAHDTSTRFVERTVTWGGGKISGAVEAGVAAGNDAAAGGSRVVEFTYDAAGNVIAVGRGVADSGTEATRRAVGAAADATESALAVVIPAIIGAARDAGSRTDADERARSAAGSAREATDRAVAAGAGAAAAAARAVREAADRVGAGGREGGGTGPAPGTGDRVADRGFETAAGTTGASAVGQRPGSVGTAAAAASGGKGGAGDTARDQGGSGKSVPTAPPQVAGFSGEMAGQRAAAQDGRDGATVHGDGGGERSPPTPPPQRTADTARQVGGFSGEMAGQRAVASDGKGGTGDAARDQGSGGKSVPTAPPQVTGFSGEMAGQRAAAQDGRDGATVHGDGGGSRSPPTPPPQRTADTATQVTSGTSAERGTAAAATVGGVSVTAVQVHEGAVSVADATGEMAVRRGNLTVVTGGAATAARFDGTVTNTAPNPGGFAVNGRLFGAASGDSPAAGLYTLVRSGRISMTQAAQDILLAPGEVGYADDKGGAPVRLRDVPRFLEGDRNLAVAEDTSALMCRPASGRGGDSALRRSAVRGPAMSDAIAAAAGLPGAGTWGRPGSRVAPEDGAAYRDFVGTAHFAATSGMSAATKAAYWGALDAGDFAARVQVTGESTGAGMRGDGFGVRGVGPTGGAFGEPAAGFAGGNDPGRGAAASVRDSGKWIGGQRYGGTFAADRAGLTRSGDIAIGAGDGMGDFRGSGRGNAASPGSWGPPSLVGYPDVAKTPSPGVPTGIPYPVRGAGDSSGAAGPRGPRIGLNTGQIGVTQGNETGVLEGIVSNDTMGAKPAVVTKPVVGTKTERDDVLGGGDVVAVLNRADAGQMANAIRRQIGAITGAAGGAGDGRTDQQDQGGGGPMIMDRGAQTDAKRGSEAAGALNMDTVFRINQLVNPGAQ